MPTPDSDKSAKGSDGTAYIVVLAVAAASLVVVPVLIAVGLFAGLRRWARRAEGLVLAAVGAVGLLLDPAGHFGAYVGWLVNLFTGDDSRLGTFPWVSLLLMGALLAGAALALQGTRAASWIPTSIGAFRPKAPKAESVLPTHEERARAAVVAPPTGGPTINASQHSITAPRPPGQGVFPVGYDKHNRPVLLSEKELGMHGLIFGSTGSGKSETIKAIMGGLLDLGWDGMVVDLKEDTAPGGLRDWCDTYAQHHSLPYQELRLSDPAPRFWFNPLAGMGMDEARDTILSMQSFDSGYYEALNKQQLGELLTLLYAANEVDPTKFPTPTFGEIGRILSANSIKAAVKGQLAVVTTNTNYTPDDFVSLMGVDKNFNETARGLGARIASENASNAGRVILSPPASGVDRPLLDVTQGGVTYVGLDSTGKVALSKVISTAVLKRMSVYASDRISGKVSMRAGEKPKPRFLIIDEANFVDRMVVMALLSRARSSGISVILCTQGPLDWKGAPGEPDANTLVQNTNVVIIMSQGDRESAEICADIIGRAERTSISHQMRAGEVDEESGSLRTSVEHLVSPDQLRSFGIGEGVIRIGKPTEKIVWTKISMRDPRGSARRL